MAGQSDDTITKHALLKLIEAVRAVMTDTSRAEALLADAEKLALRIDRARGQAAEGRGKQD